MDKNAAFHDLLLESKTKHSYELASFIVKSIGLYYKLHESYYVKKTRSRNIVEARQMAMYMVRKHTDLTLKRIAAMFEKDHATVMHSVQKIKDYKFYDKHTRREIVDIEYIIKFRSEAIKKNANWRKQYYFVDLNNISIFNFDDDKAILLTGYSDEEIEKLSESFVNLKKTHTLENTGMYILEKIKPKENE